MTPGFGLATPDERPAVEALLRANDWEVDRLDLGEVWVARDDGEVIGVVHVQAAGPDASYVESALVREDRRGKGVGAELMRSGQQAHPRTVYLACHDNRIAFYERLGYGRIEESDLPAGAREVAYATKDLPTGPGHVHHLMRRND